jgi:DNA repair exonuclease SbcCD ATPase subunit
VTPQKSKSSVAKAKPVRKAKPKATQKLSTPQSRSKPKSMADERKDRVSAPPAAQAASPEGGAGSLDKVREILFGSQARDYEKRFTRLEERLIKESADLKDEMRSRMESLETYIKKEIEAVSDQLKSEHNDRKEANNELARELKDLTKAFDKKTGQMDDLMTKNQRELREQILDQSKKLSDEIRQKHEDLLEALERESSELRFEKTDRQALAAMFTELAMRLNNEFHIPGSEDLENA